MRYSVTPASWYPNDALQILSSQRRCCVGVSVGQPSYRGRRLSSLLSWLDAHAHSVLLLVGDRLLRHTIHLATGIREADKLAALAWERGKAQIDAISAAAHAFPALELDIVPISTIIDTPAFDRHYAWIGTMERSSKAFSDSLTTTARTYLRQYASQGRRMAVSGETAIDLCTEYLREELAAFSVVHERGWLVDVYPGPELPVLLEIAQGRHPGAPDFLQNRVSISLEHVRQRSAPCTLQEAHHGSLQPSC